MWCITRFQELLVFNQETNTMDMEACRCTAMKHNQRLHLPKPRPPAEEAALGARQDIWLKTATDYIEEHCLEKGVSKVNNLSASERIGLCKLRKKIKSGEIIVLPSDKGNTFTVSSLESYARQGDTHTAADKKIT